MKKKYVLIGAALVMALSAIGCGKEATTLKELNPSKYVTLGDYKGLEVASESTEVTEEEVESEIESILQNNAEEKEVTGRAIKEGDIVNIDYEGKLDGVAFEGGSTNGAGTDLTIGSGRLIDGFEDGLVGKNTGDKLDLNLQFPAEYPKAELAGKPVVFSVSINAIKEKIVPELTDELVQKIDSACKTVDEYKAVVKSNLETSKKTTAENTTFNSLMEQAVANSKIKDAPEWLLTDKKDQIYKSAESYAKNYGMDFSSFVTQYLGQTEAQFEEEAVKYAQMGAQQSLVVYAIAKAEKLDLSDEEISDAITLYSKNYGYETEEKFKEETDMNAFEEYILKSKVQNFLFDNAKITDAAGVSGNSTSANSTSEDKAE